MQIVASFLQNCVQYVNYNSKISTYINSAIRTPQGTKLCPLLRLIHSKDFYVHGFSHVKYTDDTHLYKAAEDHGSESATLHRDGLFLTICW